MRLGPALVATVAVLAAGGAHASAASGPEPQAQAAKRCAAGYVKARIDGESKCLHAGQYCKRAKERQYRKYGFSCKGNGRLRRA